MKRLVAILAVIGSVVIASVAAPTGVAAQSPEATPEDRRPSASERLQEGAAAIVEGLRLLMDQLHSYQPPEILPNGDIIIRRRSPQDSDPAPAPNPPEGEENGPLRL